MSNRDVKVGLCASLEISTEMLLDHTGLTYPDNILVLFVGTADCSNRGKRTGHNGGLQ